MRLMPKPKFDCQPCDGTGTIVHEGLLPYYCTECNGTGMRGDPRLGFWVVMIFTIVTTVIPLYLYFR